MRYSVKAALSVMLMILGMLGLVAPSASAQSPSMELFESSEPSAVSECLIKRIDYGTRDWLQSRVGRKLPVDDYMQYAPLVSMYVLDLCGVKARHNFRDRVVLTATSSLIMGSVTNGLKYSTGVMRPDGSTPNSFPSGHTAMAFMGAELLRSEYSDVSPWIGVAGYSIAAGTGFLRMYNNRHWLSDVLAGACVGILSARVSYWINNPSMNRRKSKR